MFAVVETKHLLQLRTMKHVLRHLTIQTEIYCSQQEARSCQCIVKPQTSGKGWVLQATNSGDWKDDPWEMKEMELKGIAIAVRCVRDGNVEDVE